jgi:hypothetical protein
MGKRRVFMAAAAAFCAVTRLTLAEGTAQVQFDYGLAEMEAGRYETGCAALAESYRLDPHPGVLFTLAECENRWGKIASALTHYDAYLDLFEHMSAEQRALQRGRDKISASQRERLRSEVPELTLALPADAPPGTVVTRDGTTLGAPSLGVALPVDPGEHLVVARTPDGVLHETRFAMARGEHLSVTAAVKERAPEGPLAPPAARAVPTTTGDTLGTAAWLAGGVGAVGLLVGSIAGGLVLGEKSIMDAHCRPDDTCDAVGLSASNRAKTAGIVSDVGFVVGAAGVAAALLLFVVPRSPRASRAPLSAVHIAGELAPHGAIVGIDAAW